MYFKNLLPFNLLIKSFSKSLLLRTIKLNHYTYISSYKMATHSKTMLITDEATYNTSLTISFYWQQINNISTQQKVKE